MEQYFYVNSIKKKEMLRKWRRAQIRWKFGFPVLLAASVICAGVTIAIFVGMSMYTTAGTFISVMTAIIFLLIPGIIIQALWLRLFRTTGYTHYFHINETVYVNDIGVQEAFQIVRYNETEYTENSTKNNMTVLQIPFENIVKITINDYFGILKIFGLNEQIDYYDYTRGLVKEHWSFEDRNPLNHGIYIMMYYDEIEKLLQILEEKTGLTINHYSDLEAANEM